MNWIELLEHRRRLVIGGVLLVTLATLIVTSLRSPIAYDSFWHLQMGRDWVENGLSPWVDHYSFTYRGQEISNPPVAFQVLLHFAVAQLGERYGFVAVKLACFLLVLASVLFALRQMKASSLVYALVIPVIAYLLQLRALVRPELISYTFSILAMMFYFRAGGRVSAHKVLPIALLMLIWTNYHRSAIVGFVIFCGFFLDCAVRQYSRRVSAGEWGRWLGWGLLVFMAGFVNPDFSHPVVEALLFPVEWKQLIAEYHHNWTGFQLAGIWPLAVLSLVIPYLGARQHHLGLVFIWAVLVYAAIDVGRMVAVAGIVCVIISARLLTEAGIPARWSSAGRKTLISTGACAMVLISAALSGNVERARYFMDENRQTVFRFPQSLVDYVEQQNMSGRIFNGYGIGGYLIYRLSRQVDVYIDGRTDMLYPVEHLHQHMRATESPDNLRSLLDARGVDMIAWRHSQHLHDLVVEMQGFDLEFMDADHALYVRGRGNFPILGRLLSRPACWNQGMLTGLKSEQARKSEILPFYSRLFPYADFVVGFAGARVGKEYFDQSIENEEWTDDMRRFAGFQLLESEHHEVTIMLFGGIEDRRPQDFFAPALVALTERDTEFATWILQDYSTREWSYIAPGDLRILRQLFRMLAELRDLTMAEEKYVENLQAMLLEYDVPGEPFQLDRTAFCPHPGT